MPKGRTQEATDRERGWSDEQREHYQELMLSSQEQDELVTWSLTKDVTLPEGWEVESALNRLQWRTKDRDFNHLRTQLIKKYLEGADDWTDEELGIIDRVWDLCFMGLGYREGDTKALIKVVIEDALSMQWL